MKNFILIISVFFFQAAFAQHIDFLKIKKYKVAKLSDSLKENSGLAFFNGKMLTFNDSGNSSDIFEINPASGKIKNIYPTNLINKDWEAITSDSTSIYIGDFGNNAGNRKDLKVYKIPFNGNSIADSVKTITYFYPEQKDFTDRNLNNNFDAEAMIFLSGKLHIFTKEWASRATTHYTINTERTEIQAAEKSESFQTDFVVTDAAYFAKKLYLIGYTKKTEVFLSVFNESEPSIFFRGKPKKYYLGSSLAIGQIEGIEVDEKGVYISGEEFRSPLGKAAAILYYIPHNKIK